MHGKQSPHSLDRITLIQYRDCVILSDARFMAFVTLMIFRTFIIVAEYSK